MDKGVTKRHGLCKNKGRDVVRFDIMGLFSVLDASLVADEIEYGKIAGLKGGFLQMHIRECLQEFLFQINFFQSSLEKCRLSQEKEITNFFELEHHGKLIQGSAKLIFIDLNIILDDIAKFINLLYTKKIDDISFNQLRLTITKKSQEQHDLHDLFKEMELEPWWRTSIKTGEGIRQRFVHLNDYCSVQFEIEKDGKNRMRFYISSSSSERELIDIVSELPKILNGLCDFLDRLYIKLREKVKKDYKKEWGRVQKQEYFMFKLPMFFGDNTNRTYLDQDYLYLPKAEDIPDILPAI